MATPEEVHRNQLFQLAVLLSCGSPPLRKPFEFLVSTLRTLCFQGHLTKPVQPSSIVEHEDWELLWFRWMNPNLILDNEVCTKANAEAKKDLHFDKYTLDNMRPRIMAELQKLGKRQQHEATKTEKAFIRHFGKERILRTNLVSMGIATNGDFRSLSGRETDIMRMQEVWAVAQCAMSLMLYYRTFRTEYYSYKINPGWVDMTQAVYLPEVSIFVTDDGPFRRLLRYAKLYTANKVRVMNYAQFREKILGYLKETV